MRRAVLKLSAVYSQNQMNALGDAFGDLTLAHTVIREKKRDDSPWLLEWLFEESPPSIGDLNGRLYLQAALNGFDLAELSWTFEDVPTDFDWLSYSYHQIPPFAVGSFFVYGSHYEGDVPDSQIGLQIDAATAFGSGEHGTTAGCLRALLNLKDSGFQPKNILDMGTGSGILAIAARKLWADASMLAVDNDAEAVRVAAHHCALNKTEDIEYVVGDGFAADIAQRKKPFDLIIANILAGPLKDMAPDVLSASNGFVILSGVLTAQADDVTTAYQGFTIKNRRDIGEWATLTLQKN